jgi:hypothetical protein
VAQKHGARSASAGTALPTDPAELEREIARRRARLADTVSLLAARARPHEVVRRGLGDLSRRVHGASRTQDGELRTERVGAVAAAVALVILVLIWRGRRSR